jgi:acylphosphatase
METAVRFSIRGFVTNMKYDTVYIEAEGTEEDLERFRIWCRKGPLGARVENVQVQEAPMKNFTSFEIQAKG